MRILATITLLYFAATAYAQKVMWMKPKNPIVCYGVEAHGTSHIPAPESYTQTHSGGRTKASNFEVTYNGFTPDAQAAFQKAVDIWESIISSPVTIYVTANWTSLDANVLGSATAGTFYANFDGAQHINTWYPVALAEKMAGKELNQPNDPDIFAQFNSNNTSWYMGTDGATPAGKYDLVTVVLHELGHGLGFLDSYNIANDIATVGLASTGIPVVYDLGIENKNKENLFIKYENSTDGLKAQLTGANLFYNSQEVNKANTNSPAKIYAPTTFSSGSSIAHLDETTFQAGSLDALMTPQIGTGESIFNPGGIVTGMFSDMGWVFTRIVHQKLPNIENTAGPYTVTATITSETAPTTTPTLTYSTDGNDQTINMTPTGNANEYSATIPTTNVASTYRYYISVNDNLNRTYTKPGKRTVPVTGTTQQYFFFETGEDNKAPIVKHTPSGFISPADKELVVEAYITDNIGIASAKLEYSINDVAQSPIDIQLQTPNEDSVYKATINLGNGLAIGSVVKYQIVAVDNSSNSNKTIDPTSGFHEVPVEGLGTPIDSYTNNFNNPSTDFFGNGFSIATPNSFTTPAIHSEHPYINGDGFPNNERNLIYQLKFPIKVKSSDSYILFDEIVLVEPGAAGSKFGDANFFDYVVVEGSKDGGTTWIAFADGYDARAHNDWLTRFNSQTDANQNSTATGDPSLFKKRQIDMLSKFKTGDEVAVRFKLHIDQLASGWGWAIDNLKIQTDIVPPQILHNHIDYIKIGEDFPVLKALAKDEHINSLKLYYAKNAEPEQFITADTPADYSFQLPIPGLANGDVVKYKFIAMDEAGNEAVLPTTGYFTTKVITFGASVNQYNNNFESTTSDFVGNFFSVEKPTGFSGNALHSTHPYPNGFGLDGKSNYIATLTKPIKLNDANPHMRFDEIAVVQGQDASVAFGTEAFNDYVIVEGSKNGGQTWLPFANGYDATGNTSWSTAFNNGTVTSSLVKQRLINLLENKNFSANEEVLIRFRLFADATSNGWGWAIDNLYIQDIVTSLEAETSNAFEVYPNPTEKTLFIKLPHTLENIHIQLHTPHGQELYVQTTGNEHNEYIVDINHLPIGMYLLKISDGQVVHTRKIFKNK